MLICKVCESPCAILEVFLFANVLLTHNLFKGITKTATIIKKNVNISRCLLCINFEKILSFNLMCGHRAIITINLYFCIKTTFDTPCKGLALQFLFDCVIEASIQQFVPSENQDIYPI